MFLSIDLGDRRCGTAIEIQGIIVPKDIVERTKIIETIKKYKKEYQITDIVVGLPYDLYGKNTRQLDKTLKFIEKLSNIFPEINIHKIDERYTTYQAESILDLMGFREQEGKKDALSAVFILESFMKSKNNEC